MIRPPIVADSRDEIPDEYTFYEERKLNNAVAPAVPVQFNDSPIERIVKLNHVKIIDQI